MSSSQERHAEILRRAQDICLESEERANTFQQQAQSAEGAVKVIIKFIVGLSSQGFLSIFCCRLSCHHIVCECGSIDKKC